MANFSYTARDNDGKVVAGELDAPDEQNAISLLLNKGLMVVNLEQKAQRKKKRRQNRGRSKPPTSSCSPGNWPQ